MTTGIVESVSTKNVNTKFGSKPTYSMKVNGTWIKCGFKNPNVQVGYEVEFDGVSGTYGVETKSVNILRKDAAPFAGGAVAAAGTPSVAAPKASYGGYSQKVFPIPALHGDRSIVRQNALARATDLFIAARGGKTFELDETTLSMVISFARKFEAYTAGDLDMAEAIAENEASVE